MFTRLIKSIVLLVTAVSLARAETPWERYLNEPTSENARTVDSAAYSDSMSLEKNLFYDLELLAVQVISRDRDAVRLAFRLLPTSDGHFSERLDVMLGRLIRIDPKLFLEELLNNREKVVGYDGLLGNCGEVYVDRFLARKYELQRRYDAIESVTAPELSEIKHVCLQVLQESLE